MKLVLKLSSLIIALLFVGTKAYGWDGVVSGRIYNFEVTHGNNFAFRLSIANAPGNCGTNSPGWSYINEQDSNYKVYVVNLMTARTLGLPVTIYTNKVGDYCQIGHMSY